MIESVIYCHTHLSLVKVINDTVVEQLLELSVRLSSGEVITTQQRVQVFIGPLKETATGNENITSACDLGSLEYTHLQRMSEFNHLISLIHARNVLSRVPKCGQNVGNSQLNIHLLKTALLLI